MPNKHPFLCLWPLWTLYSNTIFCCFMQFNFFQIPVVIDLTKFFQCLCHLVKKPQCDIFGRWWIFFEVFYFLVWNVRWLKQEYLCNTLSMFLWSKTANTVCMASLKSTRLMTIPVLLFGVPSIVAWRLNLNIFTFTLCRSSILDNFNVTLYEDCSH